MCTREDTGRAKRNRTGPCALTSSELEAAGLLGGGEEGWRGAADHVTSCLVLSSLNLSVLTNHLF